MRNMYLCSISRRFCEDIVHVRALEFILDDTFRRLDPRVIPAKLLEVLILDDTFRHLNPRVVPAKLLEVLQFVLWVKN